MLPKQLELRGALGDLGGEDTVQDTDLLQRVMEVREQVEAAAHESELAGLRQQNQHEEQECVQVRCSMHMATAPLEALMQNRPDVLLLSLPQALAEAFTRDDLEEAATLAKQLRYITRIGEAIRDKG